MGRTSFAILAHVADNPQLQDPGALTRAEIDRDLTLANPINITRDAGKDVTQAQVGVTATRPLAGDGSISATVFGLRRALSNPIASMYIELDRWAYGFRASGTFPLTAGRGRRRATGTITAGLDGQWLRDGRINQNVTRTQVTRDQLELVYELGPFAQVVMTPWPSTTVTAGARYDRVRFEAQDHFITSIDGDDSGIRLMDAPSVSAGIAIQIRDALIPYASVSTSFETPTTTELGNQPTAAGGFNPNLAPQKALNYEIGARGLLLDRIRYSAALYRAEVRDELIGFDVPGVPGRRFFRNAGSSRHEGAEVGVTATPVRGIKVRGGYTYSRHRFLKYQTATANLDGKELPGVPRHYVSGSATVDVAGRGWLTVEKTVSSSYFVDDPNTVRNAAWTSTDVRAGLDVKLAAWSVSAFGGVANLWNARYAGSVIVNAANGRFFEPAPPRSFFVGVEIGAK